MKTEQQIREAVAENRRNKAEAQDAMRYGSLDVGRCQMVVILTNTNIAMLTWVLEDEEPSK